MSLEIYYNDGTPKYCGMPDMQKLYDLSNQPNYDNIIKLIYVNDHDNQMKLPKLPKALEEFQCWCCNLDELPELPSSLTKLHFTNNNIRELPDLPSGLIFL